MDWHSLPPLDLADIGEAFKRTSGVDVLWVELYAEQRTTNTIRLSDGGIAEIRSDLDLGAGVRVASSERVGYAYTNVLSRRSLLEAAEAAVIASGATSRSGNRTVFDLRELGAAPAQHASQPPENVQAPEKVTFLRRVDEAARAVSGEVRDVTATHVDVTQTVLVATTDGGIVRDERVRTRLTCQVTARRDGRLETGFDGPGIGGGMELYDGDEPEAIGTRAAQRALRALDGVEAPSGPMQVVLGPSGGGLLLHEACGHGLEADGLTRDSSIYARSIGRRVGSPLVTAVDDPSMPGAFGSYGVDDEGYDSSRTTLLDHGMQTGALTDRENSVAAVGRRSANGRRQSYAQPPLPRMSNTFILPGPQSAESLLGALRRGVYVVRLRGGDVDVTTGEFAFTASEAFLVENGEIVRPLLSLTLLGNGPNALASVEAVGDDLAFTQALCGKEGQWVPVSYGSPTLLINGLSISGAADA